MLRTISYIIGATLILGAGVYAYFHYVAEEEPVSIAQLLPEDALWVYHSEQLPTDWALIRGTPLGKALISLPDVLPVSQTIPYLDSLVSLTSWLEDHSCYIVGHVTGNDDLGLSFYLELDGPTEVRAWQEGANTVLQSPDWQIEERQYQGVSIQEWTYVPRNIHFSWVRLENILMGSFTPFLVEDQVRRQTEQEVADTWRTALTHNALSQRDQGDFFVNGRQLGALFSMFTVEKQKSDVTLRNTLCRTMLLDVTVEEDQWLLNGFSEFGGTASEFPYYLSTFNNQTARPFSLGNYLPTRTSGFRQYAFADIQEWMSQVLEFSGKQLSDSLEFQRLHRRFEQKTGRTLTDWLAWAGQNMGVISLETSTEIESDKLIVVEIEDLSALEEAMQAFQNPTDSLSYQEDFAGYTLRSLNDPTLAMLLLGESDEPGQFSNCFWFQDTSFLVMSNRVNALKRLIADQRTENTWSKSVRQSRFLERSLDPATFSLVLNLPRFRERWYSQLSPKWMAWADEQKALLQQLEKVAIQFSPMDDDFYSSIALTYQPQPIASSSGYTTREQLLLDTTLISKPFVVRNHTNQQWEVLVQDKAQAIHLLSTSDQAALWSDSLQADIIGEVQQIDFYRNNKLQYLFATDSALHLIDRTGTYIPGFPLYLSGGIELQYLSVFDYDQSRNYRFLLTDRQGNLRMFNQDRENLDGWDPLTLTAPLADAPQHIRVRGRDCIIALQQDGILHVLNRRGEEYPGFPMNWEQTCRNPVFVEIGNTFAETILTTVTNDGELISVNLEGTLLKREQLFRASSTTHFLLSPDVLGKTFILARQDDQRLSILNANGVSLFEQSYFTPGALSRDELSVQFYDFGAGNQIIAITDKIQEFTYLFDEEGKLQNDRPIESTNEIALLYSEANNQYQVYRVYADELSVVSF